ncbi:C-type lectin 37Da-like [Contarinia nasturtii]|uniref:C-type lectin 37Da-like n=1 Tax=Contarinia nasturtii TaxID=265458 RepID=UPI0012D493EF|nr:C-type lectin 37Da-like [Contarinia nasturtii]
MELKRGVIGSIFFFALIAPIFGQLFYPRHKINKKYHFFTLSKANWYKSFIHCRSLEMNLVSISSKAEQDRIVQQIRDEGHEESKLWTSGTKLSDNITWEWMGNGKRVTFTNWASGQPGSSGNTDEKCIQIFNKNRDHASILFANKI